MALRVTSTSVEAKVHGVKATIYGRSGVGKTMLARTAPEPVIIAAEPGLLSLSEENQIRIFGDYFDIPVWEAETLDDLNTAISWLELPECPYKSVFMDSMSEVAEQVLTNALRQVSDPRQAYGELFEKMTMTLKAFRDIKGKHVFFVAKQTLNRENATPIHIPMMPGKQMGPAMPYLTDLVLHLDVGKTPEGVSYRYLQTQPDINFDAKDRSGALEIIEEPNLTKLISKIIPA